MTDDTLDGGETRNRAGGPPETDAEPKSLGDWMTQRQRKRYRVGDTILGRYRILGELGQGGMGLVYRCLDEVGGIEAAVKMLPPEVVHDSGEMEEVRENFALVARLAHPHIATVRTLERDLASGEYFLIMELAPGESLRAYRKRKGGRLALHEVVAIVRQIAAAMDYAHAQKVIHRDIKPSNVMIAADGSVKVLDFGLAAQIQTSVSRVSQVRQGTSGTGPYMAPEQWRGRLQEARTDLYALAVTAYELLAGHLPFESSDPIVLREAVLEDPPSPIEGLSPSAWAALQKGMAKDPGERGDSCQAFVAELAGESTVSPVSGVVAVQYFQQRILPPLLKHTRRAAATGKVAVQYVQRSILPLLLKYGRLSAATVMRAAARSPWLARLLERTVAVIVSPRSFWHAIETDPTPIGRIYRDHLLVLAALPLAASVSGMLSRHRYSGSLIVLWPSVVGGVLRYALTLVAILVAGRLVHALAGRFGAAPQNRTQSFKVVAYAMTPVFLAGLFAPIPVLSLLAVPAVLYGAYLIHLGLLQLMGCPRSKVVGYTVATFAGLVALHVLVGMTSDKLASPVTWRRVATAWAAHGPRVTTKQPSTTPVQPPETPKVPRLPPEGSYGVPHTVRGGGGANVAVVTNVVWIPTTGRGMGPQEGELAGTEPTDMDMEHDSDGAPDAADMDPPEPPEEPTTPPRPSRVPFRLNVKPVGAAITLTHDTLGVVLTTNATANTIVSMIPTGAYSARATAPGFRHAEQDVVVPAFGGMWEIALPERGGSLTVKTNPGASVLAKGRRWGDDTPLGRADTNGVLRDIPLRPGVHEIVAVLADHSSATGIVTSVADRADELSLRLPPLPGRIRINGREEVVVWRDGTRMGHAGEWLSLPAGDHVLDLVCPGYRAGRIEVSIPPNRDVVKPCPDLAAECGAVRITAGVPSGWEAHFAAVGKQIRIADKPWKAVPELPWVETEVACGTIEAELAAVGYGYADRGAGLTRSLVKDGATTDVRFVLAPLAARLTVRCEAAGAEVWMDGRRVGAAGAAIDLPPMQPFKIEVRAAGHRAATLALDAMEPARAYDKAVTLEKKTVPDLTGPWENSLGMKFVPVPGTEVLFSVWETRNRDYRMFKPGHDSGLFEGRSLNGDDQPASDLPWKDAQAFCEWLTRTERQKGLLGTNQVYRLPADWEWSVAVGLREAREGSPEDKSEKVPGVFPWGAQWPPPPRSGNFADVSARRVFFDWTVIEQYDDGFAVSAPVGTYGTGPAGLSDLAGNVWEWCADWIDPQQTRRVLRGGSWDISSSVDLLSSYRLGNDPNERLADCGFRVVLDAGLPKTAPPPGKESPVPAKP